MMSVSGQRNGVSSLVNNGRRSPIGRKSIAVGHGTGSQTTLKFGPGGRIANLRTNAKDGTAIVMEDDAVRFALERKLGHHALQFANIIAECFEKPKSIRIQFYRDPEFRNECWLSFEVGLTSDVPKALRELEKFESRVVESIPGRSRKFMLLSYHIA